MYEIVFMGLVNYLLLLLVAYAENESDYVNASYNKFFRKLVLIIPGRFEYFGPLTYFSALVFEVNFICWSISIAINLYAYEKLFGAVANLLLGLILLSFGIEILFYKLINSNKVKSMYEIPRIINNNYCIAIGGNVLEEVKYVEAENANELVVILPWLHDLDYDGNIRFRKYQDDETKYNFMYYGGLVNDLASKSKAALLVKYTETSRMYSVETFIEELSDVINRYFSDKSISIIAHGPQASVEALLYAQRQPVDSIKLLCGGIGVGEYYISSLQEIIKNKRTTVPWDKKILKQQINCIETVKDHNACSNCMLLETASIFENTCHGFCGKNITPYFDSLKKYSTEDLIAIMKNCKMSISIIWPQLAISSWKNHIEDWKNIENVTFEIMDNCYETFRERTVKMKRHYADVFIVR